MDIYRTEEEQIAAVQGWWKRRGPAVVTGIVLVLVAFLGWRLIAAQNLKSSEAAFIQFDRLVEAIDQARVGERLSEKDTQVLDTTVITEAELLFETHAKHTYSHLGALMVAKHHVNAKRWSQARDMLQWAIDQKPSRALALITKARLAQVHLQLGDYEPALAILDSETNLAGFEGMYQGLRGDIHVQQGDLDAARAAYEKALQVTDGTDLSLKIKLDDLTESAFVNADVNAER